MPSSPLPPERNTNSGSAKSSTLSTNVRDYSNCFFYLFNRFWCFNSGVKYLFLWCPSHPTTTVPTTVPTTQSTQTTPQTTTQTAPSTQTTTLPEPTTPLPPATVCFQCRQRRNHKDLYADETDCHYYYQCFYINETYAIGVRRQCAAGMFWHDEILQCMPEGPIPCTDPCQTDATAASGCYAGVGCRQFFVCANTASYGMCCPLGSTFNSATCACDESETCVDDCAQQGPAVQTTVAPSQTFNETVCMDSYGVYITIVPGQANAYILIDQEGQGTEIQYCPDYVNFDFGTCRCNTETTEERPVIPTQRQALLWCPFDTDLLDHSVHRFNTLPIGAGSIDTSAWAQGGGSYAADGASRIEIPGLKTFDLRSSGSWCSFFRCEQGSSNYLCNNNAGILSNNKDSAATDYTVIMAVQSSNRATCRLNFWHPVDEQTVGSAINTPANGWNHMCVTYDGNAINMHLNGVSLIFSCYSSVVFYFRFDFELGRCR